MEVTGDYPQSQPPRLRRCRFRAWPARQLPAIVYPASTLAVVNTPRTRKVRRIATPRRRISSSTRWLVRPPSTASSSAHHVKYHTAVGTPRVTQRRMPIGSHHLTAISSSSGTMRIVTIVVVNRRPMYHPPFRVVSLLRPICDPAHCHGSPGQTPIRCGSSCVGRTKRHHSSGSPTCSTNIQVRLLPIDRNFVYRMSIRGIWEKRGKSGNELTLKLWEIVERTRKYKSSKNHRFLVFSDKSRRKNVWFP